MKPRSDSLPAATLPFDLASIRAQFPILHTKVRDYPLTYLDNAASTQQPERVIETVSDYHRARHANIHRGVYELSQTATLMYDEARARVAGFLNAADPRECIFTRGTTESINLVAATWGRANLRQGDEIILSNLEHHSNIVPWQLIAQAMGAKIRVIPIDERGVLDLEAYRAMLSPRTRLVALNQVSNALGTVNPVRTIIEAAHSVGARVLIDGAQWVAHGRTDVQALDADFYVFSGHKIYGPTGIGVLYGKYELLDAMPPYQGGGDMIEQVTFAETTYAEVPTRFEAGTPNISGAIGLGEAIAWLQQYDFEALVAHEQVLLRHATEGLDAIPGVAIKGRAPHKAGVLSWVMVDPPMATFDVGMQLDLRGICVRTGHHCCQPLMDRLAIDATIRASFGIYTTVEEVDRLIEGVAAISSAARSKAAAQARKEEAGSVAPELVYPQASADSPDAAADEIAELFELLPDWPMRHQQMMDLGEQLPPMPEALKSEEHRVSGCQSQVFISARIRPGTPDVIEFLADSDSGLVRGIIALLQQLYSGQRAEDILAFDADAFLHRVGLDTHLSMTRRNGLAAMLQRLRQIASAAAQETAVAAD